MLRLFHGSRVWSMWFYLRSQLTVCLSGFRSVSVALSSRETVSSSDTDSTWDLLSSGLAGLTCFDLRWNPVSGSLCLLFRLSCLWRKCQPSAQTQSRPEPNRPGSCSRRPCLSSWIRRRRSTWSGESGGFCSCRRVSEARVSLNRNHESALC